MKPRYFLITILYFLAMTSNLSGIHAESPHVGIREEVLIYKSGDVSYTGFVAYDENIKGKRPVVFVVPEWWGLNDYAKIRAKQLAELGYLAVALDMFGGGRTAANPTEAQELTKPYYKDPFLGRSLFDAALKKIQGHPMADQKKMAAIGYCFGGYIVLNVAKSGANLKGVVSFHGGLGGLPVNKQLLKARILVCHGAIDKFVTQQDVDSFKKQMDAAGAGYTFKSYANATHAFSNPDATKTGKEFGLPIEYNAAADKDSWNDMKLFFKQIFQ
jgi:dienelactone hydrolase